MNFSITRETKVTVNHNPPEVNFENEVLIVNGNQPRRFGTKKYDLLTLEQPADCRSGTLRYSRFTQKTPGYSSTRTVEDTNFELRSLSDFHSLQEKLILAGKGDVFSMARFR